jgi:hypothetical protein
LSTIIKGAKTLSITTLSITTFSIKKLSMKGFCGCGDRFRPRKALHLARLKYYMKILGLGNKIFTATTL